MNVELPETPVLFQACPVLATRYQKTHCLESDMQIKGAYYTSYFFTFVIEHLLVYSVNMENNHGVNPSYFY